MLSKLQRKLVALLLGLWEGLYKTDDKTLSVAGVAAEPRQWRMIALIQYSHLQLCPWYDGLVKRIYFTGNNTLLDTVLLSHFLTLLDPKCDLLWSSLVLDD